jgi:hypothetical protein
MGAIARERQVLARSVLLGRGTMLSKASFEACPQCGCHVARGSASCPHCEVVFERKGGRLPPAIVAVMMGLGMVVASTVACDERHVDDDDGSGGDGDSGDWPFGDGSGGSPGTTKASSVSHASSTSYVVSSTSTEYPSAVSTYGVGPSSSNSTSTGEVCPGLDDGTPCGECLALSCCMEGTACIESQPCIDVSQCLNSCDPNDLVCATQCQEAYPEGFTLYQTLWQCASASCDKCFE